MGRFWTTTRVYDGKDYESVPTATEPYWEKSFCPVCLDGTLFHKVPEVVNVAFEKSVGDFFVERGAEPFFDFGDGLFDGHYVLIDAFRGHGVKAVGKTDRFFP